MSALVRIALDRPYTFIVMAIGIMLGGVLCALRTPIDIFPDIPIPIIATVWQFVGMSPDDMSGRIIAPFERTLTTTVNDIEHIESQSMPGAGVIKIFLQPNADVRTASAQTTAIAQNALKQMPPGVLPPLILNYRATTVPIMQLVLSAPGLTEEQIFDTAMNVIRTPLVTVPGAASPYPYGGRPRQIQVDIDPEALRSKNLSAQDVTAAIGAQSQVTPAGFAKIGEFQYNVRLNNAPGAPDELAALPIKTVDGATVFLRDVAQVRDGGAAQQNVVHFDGHRAVLQSVLKNSSISTLTITDGVKAAVKKLKDIVPPELNIRIFQDQSIFVASAVKGVVTEGAAAALLTSLMILLFLGSWRSTAIIVISIPLSILGAVALLAAFHQTLNVMTLGGLALAVGILVDEATVTIENINWHLERGKPVRTAILDGAEQIVTPAFVSLLCICIVFVPMFFLPGVSGYLFVPMALSVVFAMVMSFILSRTLVPTMAMYLLHPHAMTQDGAEAHAPSRNRLAAFQQSFVRHFERVRNYYAALLQAALGRRRPFVITFLAVVAASFVLVPFLGQNFFPEVDGGQILLHARAPIGTRIEETSHVFDQIEHDIRAVIPPEDLHTVVNNIGQSISGINTTYNASGTIGPQDGDIYISLNDGHKPTADYVRALRTRLPRDFPAETFSFLPADMVSQILNFGSPAPIDIQVTGPNAEANTAVALKILRRMREIPGVADARILQSSHYPEFRVDVDRTRMDQTGLREQDVTNSIGQSLGGTAQSFPVFWLDPQNGVSYPVVVQIPEGRVDSLDRLQSLPLTTGSGDNQILGGGSTITRGEANAVVSHYNIQSVIDIFATTQGRDLGAVAADVQKVLNDFTKHNTSRGLSITMRGQSQTMNTAFSGLAFGLLGAIVLIYLLIVVNFQSWLDPFVIITALPAALAGIAWMLFGTGTTLSVPALTGAIMCMGVATANSILVVSFARERLAATGDAMSAAFEAGVERFRPVLMTALAMVIGMIPMALGLGEGGEQNAPLGRAVIGGLMFATIATLIFVPVVFSIVHGRRSTVAAATGEAYA